MKIAIACHAWAYQDKPFDEACATIARLGFRHIDVGSGTHLDLERAALHPNAEAQRIRGILEFYQLSLSDLYVMLPYVNAPEAERRSAQLNLFERLIPFFLAAGVSGVTISPGIIYEDGSEHALARSLPALMRLSELMEETDIRLSFEAHMDSPITKPDQALMILETIPGLSLTLDYAHFIVQGHKMNELDTLLPHTAHVHLRQAVKGRLQTPFEQGRIDFKRVMEGLEDQDYHGTLTIEYMTSVGWHGMMPVNITQETVKARDQVRRLREQSPEYA